MTKKQNTTSSTAPNTAEKSRGKKQQTKQSAKLRPLTKKEKAFADHLINNPKESGTEAAMQTYNARNRKTASVIATENLAKPSVKTYLAKHNDRVEQVLFNTVDQWGEHEKPRQREIAMDTAKYIHDKIHGKATQKVETTGVHISMQIDSKDLDLIP